MGHRAGQVFWGRESEKRNWRSVAGSRTPYCQAPNLAITPVEQFQLQTFFFLFVISIEVEVISTQGFHQNFRFSDLRSCESRDHMFKPMHEGLSHDIQK